jgi:hypothetical protein
MSHAASLSGRNERERKRRESRIALSNRSALLFDVEIDAEQDQPPQDDGENGGKGSLEGADVTEVVVLLSDDQTYDDVGNGEDARDTTSHNHVAIISS